MRWFSPNPELVTEAEVALHVGGSYRIRMATTRTPGWIVTTGRLAIV